MNESEVRLAALHLAKEMGADSVTKIIDDANALSGFMLRGEVISVRDQPHPKRRGGNRKIASAGTRGPRA